MSLVVPSTDKIKRLIKKSRGGDDSSHKQLLGMYRKYTQHQPTHNLIVAYFFEQAQVSWIPTESIITQIV